MHQSKSLLNAFNAKELGFKAGGFWARGEFESAEEPAMCGGDFPTAEERIARVRRVAETQFEFAGKTGLRAMTDIEQIINPGPEAGIGDIVEVITGAFAYQNNTYDKAQAAIRDLDLTFVQAWLDGVRTELQEWEAE
ncbi:hypothetical protein RFN29_25745 [Mesorhizobium sp. VK22B]|uniref:Uncharacterized protein n=1 Tax=Mesorhizobium captivum TaxID=3072319 RepID=A0ABU4Z6V8_9HYPH|nr:hypothetical protein [Mesorhizobium sp. VK22B]MDX8494966.1 hypothetical protein [Mesorhizobium sp. VK22B]